MVVLSNFITSGTQDELEETETAVEMAKDQFFGLVSIAISLNREDGGR